MSDYKKLTSKPALHHSYIPSHKDSISQINASLHLLMTSLRQGKSSHILTSEELLNKRRMVVVQLQKHLQCVLINILMQRSSEVCISIIWSWIQLYVTQSGGWLSEIIGNPASSPLYYKRQALKLCKCRQLCRHRTISGNLSRASVGNENPPTTVG